MVTKSNYVISYAAGMYWIKDTSEDMDHYHNPLGVNECGAMIFEQMMRQVDREKIIAAMCSEYGIDWDVAKEDYEQFVEQLTAQGITLE